MNASPDHDVVALDAARQILAANLDSLPPAQATAQVQCIVLDAISRLPARRGPVDEGMIERALQAGHDLDHKAYRETLRLGHQDPRARMRAQLTAALFGEMG